MAVNPLPTPYSDLFRMSQTYRTHFERVEKELNSLLVRRDYLIFASPYLLGLKSEELLEMNFSDFKKEFSDVWHKWLDEYQQDLGLNAPWFHTARHKSIRPGLSRRSMEIILVNQADNHQLINWNILGLKHAHICKLIQSGLSDIQIRLRLSLSETFDLKAFHKFLESQNTEAQIYADIYSL